MRRYGSRWRCDRDDLCSTRRTEHDAPRRGQPQSAAVIVRWSRLPPHAHSRPHRQLQRTIAPRIHSHHPINLHRTRRAKVPCGRIVSAHRCPPIRAVVKRRHSGLGHDDAIEARATVAGIDVDQGAAFQRSHPTCRASYRPRDVPPALFEACSLQPRCFVPSPQASRFRFAPNRAPSRPAICRT